ncbi:ABC transporter ATP-binding protein [Mycobacterium sp. 236(2023)]|uniref:ABC transporter ATP-binding protein n=1 Tax=Mycobacterium sp. 236(2023) TaxID=3038163 RepID=UPI00241520D7|nr:ABC transporter ATP-binding protein [Mycobacterium sp. 236(2023)]MDG4667117.1 ABC transporter ATP-binding protein [Mycobacterium sp. 236(2023)]
MTTLAIDRLVKAFPSKEGVNTVLDHLSMRMSGNEFVSLVGPSGCGKSTLLNIVAGVEPPTDGSVSLLADDGRPARLGYVFQEPRLLPWRTIMQNMLYVVDDRSKSSKDRAMHYLQMVGLEKTADLFPHQLSGGMQQRAGIARAFSVEPDFLIMDEPFSHLDAITARGLREELSTLWMADKRMILFVTHDVMEAVQLSDRIIMLEPGGRIRADIPIQVERPRRQSDPHFAMVQADVLQKLEEMSART